GDEALRREVEDLVRLNRANNAAHGTGVLQLATAHRDLTGAHKAAQARLVGNPLAFIENVWLAAVAQRLKVVQLASPAEGAKDLDIRLLLYEVFRQEASYHARDTGDQDAHNLSSQPFSRQYSNVSCRVVCHEMRGCHPV